MKILIDGMNLALEQGTGVATYSKNLSYCVKEAGHHLSALYGRKMRAYGDPLLREAAFFDNDASRRYFYPDILDLLRCPFTLTDAKIPQTDNVLKDHIAGALPEADEYLNIMRLFTAANARSRFLRGILNIRLPQPVDIAHWTYPIPARIVGAKNVYTIHDMVPIKLPYATLDSKALHYRVLKNLARSADHFVTVSETSKKDIVDLLGVKDSFVTNTYQSVRIPAALMEEPEDQTQIELDAINLFPEAEGALRQDRAERRLRAGEFYLYVGAIEPKKNLRRIIEAYLSSGSSHPLVVVGRQAWSCEREMKLIAQGGARILYLDYVPFSQVVTLMRGARALVFASLYEGFGLPVLEAFLCGAPVITADASSTREIAGDAALLVDPYDVRAIRDAFRRLSGEAAAPLLAELSDRGRRRAAAFGEERIADRLDDLYRDVAA